MGFILFIYLFIYLSIYLFLPNPCALQNLGSSAGDQTEAHSSESPES